MKSPPESPVESSKQTARRGSVISNGLKNATNLDPYPSQRPPASATMGKPTLAKRRSPQGHTPSKLELGENLRRPSAAMALVDGINQPETASPASPHRSSPIAIPAGRRHSEVSRPTTPLTAREEKITSYFPQASPPKPQISASLRPGYQRPKAQSLQLSSWQRGHSPSNSLHQPLPSYSDSYPIMPMRNIERPSSPLADSKPISSITAGLQAQRSARPERISLPPPQGRYHPLNYQPPTSAARHTNGTAYNSANRSPYAPRHHRQGSDARRELQEQQLAVVRNITRGFDSPSDLSGSNRSTPKAPHILPRGSPGPTTPLELEMEFDYVTHHLGAHRLTEGQSTEAVDEMIRKETARGNGFHTGSSSPALSPAAV